MPQPHRLTLDTTPDMETLHALCFNEAQRWNNAAFQTLLVQEQNSAHGLYQNDNLIGFILICAVEGEAEILTLAIHPHHRRKGFAQTLINTAIAQPLSKKPEKIFLEVMATNLAAITLYKKIGFEKISVRPNYYAAPHGDAAKTIDAIIMQKNILCQTTDT